MDLIWRALGRRVIIGMMDLLARPGRRGQGTFGLLFALIAGQDHFRLAHVQRTFGEWAGQTP